MDQTAFIIALDRADNMLFRVAWAILYNEEDCRDAMQETALKAWQHRAGLRDERYFLTWITRILINECRTIQRKRRRLVSLEGMPESTLPPPDPTLALTSAAYAVSRPQILDWLLKRDATVPLWLEEAAQTAGASASADGVTVSIDSLIYDGNWLTVSFATSVDDPTQAVMIAMDDGVLLNGEPADLYPYALSEPYMLPQTELFDHPVQRNVHQWGADGSHLPELSGTVEAELTFRIYHPEKGFVMVDEDGVLTGDDPDPSRGTSPAMLQDCRDAVAAMTNVAVIEGDPAPWIAEGYTPVDRHGWLIAERDESGRLIVEDDELHLTETTLTVRFTFDADAYTVYDFSGVEVPRLRDAWVHVKTFRLSPLTCRVDVYLIPYINDTHVNNEYDSILMYQEYGKAVLTDENGNELTYTDTFWSSGGMQCFVDMEGDEWCVRYSVTMPGLEMLPESIGLTTKEGDIVRFNLP